MTNFFLLFKHHPKGNEVLGLVYDILHPRDIYALQTALNLDNSEEIALHSIFLASVKRVYPFYRKLCRADLQRIGRRKCAIIFQFLPDICINFLIRKTGFSLVDLARTQEIVDQNVPACTLPFYVNFMKQEGESRVYKIMGPLRDWLIGLRSICDIERDPPPEYVTISSMKRPLSMLCFLKEEV